MLKLEKTKTVFSDSPDLLDLPHLGPGPPVGEGEGRQGGGEDEYQRPDHHVGARGHH